MTGRRIILGRAADCDLIVDDEYASPHHAAIQEVGGYFVIEDLGSTNGTRIRRNGDDVPVRLGMRAALALGDEVVIGRTVIPWRTG